MQARELAGRVRRRAAVRERAERVRQGLVAERYARWRKQPIEQRTVLYESFFGNGMLCNPEAIFRHLLTQDDMQDLQHVWVLDRMDHHPELAAEFEGNPNVRFVEIHSPAYLKALATSKYLVNNSTFPPQFAKRAQQVYLNTWHGVPLKHMGYHMDGGGPVSRNIVRNFLAADYLLSSNPFMTRTMYRDGYRLQGIYRGAVIEEGEARTDRQHQAERDRDAVVAMLDDRGLDIAERRVVLFAPTWRGETFQDPRVNAAQLLSTVRELQAGIDSDRHVVLLKVHQAIYNAVLERVGDCDFLVPNGVPTNTVLGVTDLLVTDYSSIFFDFLATGRPILHYVPDLDEYRSGRGLYLKEDELFGPVSSTMPDLVADVNLMIGTDTDPGDRPGYDEGRAAFAGKYDGQVTERVVDVVFRGNEDGYAVHRDFGTDKETLLIYLGGMTSMGITTSALNLLRNIDYDRYDVSAFYNHARGRDRTKNEAMIDPRARVLPRIGTFSASPRRIREEKRQLFKGLPDALTPHHVEFWTDEWHRVFGMSEFDHAIDFSGYGNFCPFLFTVAKAGSKSLWLHNDMMADSQRETVGEKHLEERLQAVFTTFPYFNHLVSVSPELSTVNSKKLTAFARPEQFTYAVNTIDGDTVLRMAGVTTGKVEEQHGHVRASESGTAGTLATFDTENVASAVTSLLEHFEARQVLVEIRGRARLGSILANRGSATTFVTVGRLSPAKNQARLIRAFAKVHEKHPEIQLVVLGGGALEESLQELIQSLGMEQNIVLAGQVDNPYSIMADSDCFVLSSDYEGQPMVILEARTLGLPIITTAFSSVGDSVPADAGIIVPKTVDGVAEGLEKFLKGEVPASSLDTGEYNKLAMDQFYRAIGSRFIGPA